MDKHHHFTHALLLTAMLVILGADIFDDVKRISLFRRSGSNPTPPSGKKPEPPPNPPPARQGQARD